MPPGGTDEWTRSDLQSKICGARIHMLAHCEREKVCLAECEGCSANKLVFCDDLLMQTCNDSTHLIGTSKSRMSPLMNEARLMEAPLISAASLEMVSFESRSSRTLMLCAVSLADIV